MQQPSWKQVTSKHFVERLLKLKDLKTNICGLSTGDITVRNINGGFQDAIKLF